MLVVDDGDRKLQKKNAKLLSKMLHAYYEPREREMRFRKFFGSKYQEYPYVIPDNCHAKTSFGFLIAYEEQADLTIDLDVNNCVFPGVYPCDQDSRAKNYAWSAGKSKCVLNMGLWTGQSDLEALTIMYNGDLNGRSTIEVEKCVKENVVLTKPREFIQDLDNVPFPAYAPASTRLSEAKNEIVVIHIGSLGYCLEDLELTRSEI